MTNHHPITPSQELVQQWASGKDYDERDWIYERHIATQAAQWAADRELDECCHLLRLQGFDVIDDLRATRRPKPPTLKAQALLAIDTAVADDRLSADVATVIRRALNELPDN